MDTKIDLENIDFQRVLVFEHFFRKKSVETLAEYFEINPIDLRFFFYSIESRNVYEKIKEELKDYPEQNSIEELKVFLVDKLKTFLTKSTPREASDLVLTFTPQIIGLENALNSYKQTIKSYENAEFEEVMELNDKPMIEIEYTQPKLLVEEDLSKLPKPEMEENEKD